MPLIDRGLDLLSPDVTTPEERRAFVEFYQKAKGHSLPGFDFWMDFRPDVLKRFRMQARQTPSSAGRAHPLITILSYVHYYTIVGYTSGVDQEMHLAHSLGASKEQIIETLAVAFLHAGPWGMNLAAPAGEFLNSYPDPIQGAGRLFPDGWEPDPDAFRSGIDFSSPEMSSVDMEKLEQWYLKYLGEVPNHFLFFARNRPNLLKAHRHRFETAIRGALPKQMMPCLLLSFEILRGNAAGIREAVLLARGFGLTKLQVLDSICSSFPYCGLATVDLVQATVGTLLEEWKET